jgi:hypothetical protein
MPPDDGVIMNHAGRPGKPAKGKDSSPSVCLARAFPSQLTRARQTCRQDVRFVSDSLCRSGPLAGGQNHDDTVDEFCLRFGAALC